MPAKKTTPQQKEIGKRGKALGQCYESLGLTGRVLATKGSLLDQCIEAKLEAKK